MHIGGITRVLISPRCSGWTLPVRAGEDVFARFTDGGFYASRCKFFGCALDFDSEVAGGRRPDALIKEYMKKQ